VIGAPVAPIAVTQDNCLAALGIEPRRFLALIHERQIQHTKLGKLRLVRVEHLLAALEAEPARAAVVEGQGARLGRAAGFAHEIEKLGISDSSKAKPRTKKR